MNRADSHLDVAGYLTAEFRGPDLGTARRHIASCVACRDEVRTLQPLVHHIAAAVPVYVVPAGLEARTLRTVRGRAAPPRRRPGPGRRRLLAGALVAVVLGGVAIVAGVAVGSGDPPTSYAAELRAPGSATGADLGRVLVTGDADRRSVQVDSAALRSLPGSSYYELWFVANRQPYSAGRLTLDTSGRSMLSLPAQIDPAAVSLVIITAEPADGNPLPTGPEVLRGNLTR